MHKTKPDSFQSSPSVPCKTMANYALEIAKNLLLDECANNNGVLSSKQIDLLFQKLEQAPGSLNSIYSNNFNTCSSAVRQSFKNTVKLSTSFQRELKDIVGDKARSIEVGHLQNIGLNNVKNILGKKWEKVSKRVDEIADKCIRDRLTGKDIFVRGKDNDFIICFAELSGEEALFKAKAIESDLIQAVLGDEAKKHFVKLNLDANQMAQLANFSMQSHQIEVKPDEINSGNLYETLLVKVQSEAAKHTSNIQGIIEKISNEGFIVPSFKKTPSNNETNNAIAHWDKKSEASLYRLGNTLLEDRENLLYLDSTTLLASAKYLCDNPPASGFVLTVNVHYATIKNKKSSSAFLELCSSLKAEIRKHLNFNIISMVHEDGVEGLLNNCNVLLHYCNFISVQFKSPAYPLNDIFNTEYSSVIFEFQDYLLAMRTHHSQMLGLVNKLAARKIPLIINNVPNKLINPLFNKVGIKFLYPSIV